MKTTLFRNTLAVMAALFTALFALPQKAGAQEDYKIRIGGVAVTSANYWKISAKEGFPAVKEGRVNYDPSTKTLILENATINATGNNKGIEGNTDGLTIQVKGTSKVTAQGTSALGFRKEATLTGGGTLNATSSGECGIYVNQTHLTLNNLTVNAKGKYGIAGSDGSVETLTIRNADVTAESNGQNSSLCDFKSLTLDSCEIVQPTGAAFDASLRGMALDGRLVKTKVTIRSTFYALWIAGVQVTSANCDDLSVIDGVTGTAKYDPATKTLILENATINATGKIPGVRGETDGLTVLVKGTVNVTVQGTSAIGFSKAATLTGGGTLNATSDANCGLLANKADLTLDGLTLNAKGKWGISGQPSEPKTLTIRNANVTAEGNGTEASFCDFKTITFDGCEILQPEDAAFDAWVYGVAIDGQFVKKKVVIKAAATSYGLYVAGKQVTSANCADLTVISGVTGTAYYDHSTQTLTLDNAAINAPGTESCIVGETAGLTVRVKGTVNLTSPNGNTLAFLRNATLTGDGTLNVTSKRKCGIFIQQDLTIKDCTANVKGAWGIAGGNGSAETLAIRNATVTAEGTNGSVCNLKALTLDGNLIIQPTGAAFNASLKGVALGGQLVKTKVTIGPLIKYDLEIAGVQVTSLNAADLTVLPGVTGTVKYDHTTKTLTLQDATINTTGNTRGIEGNIDGLTIQVKGTVNITAQKNSGIIFLKPATLTGGGTLNATSSGECGIYVYKTHLTLDGLTLNAKGKWGIAGEHGHSETLTVKNATVTAECDGTEGSIIAFKALVLDGCAITTPAGAAFDPALRGVALNGQVVKTKVEIAPVPNAIDAPRASEAGAKRTGIYSLRGVKTDAPLESLPAGVYIYNGKKVVKQ